jgi:hypothetical protein
LSRKALFFPLEIVPNKTFTDSSKLWRAFEKNKKCVLADSSKTAHRILIFLIPMGADYSFYVKSIATFALTFFE